MRSADVPAGVALCRASRWNQTAREWELFLAQAPGRVTVAEVEGAVAGTALVLPYDARTGWVAMVLVDPERRGRGIGRALLLHAIDSAPSGESLWLDATPAGRTLYLTLGFTDGSAISRWRHPGVVTGAVGRGLRPLQPRDWAAVAALDRIAFGADRRAGAGLVPRRRAGARLGGRTRPGRWPRARGLRVRTPRARHRSRRAGGGRFAAARRWRSWPPSFQP